MADKNKQTGLEVVFSQKITGKNKPIDKSQIVKSDNNGKGDGK